MGWIYAVAPDPFCFCSSTRCGTLGSLDRGEYLNTSRVGSQASTVHFSLGVHGLWANPFAEKEYIVPQGFDSPDPADSLARLSLRVFGAFSSVYLTLISIIQGAAFAYLAGFAVTNYTHFKTPIAWILVCASFVVILLAWNEYLMGALAFVWIPTILDAFIPFGLGVTEVLLISAIADDPQTWLGFLTIFTTAGVIAYVNLYGNAYARRYRQENAAAIAALGPWWLITLVWAGLSMFVFGALFWLAHSNGFPLHGEGLDVSLAVTLGALIWLVIFFVRGWWYWARISQRIVITLRRDE